MIKKMEKESIDGSNKVKKKVIIKKKIIKKKKVVKKMKKRKTRMKLMR